MQETCKVRTSHWRRAREVPRLLPGMHDLNDRVLQQSWAPLLYDQTLR